MQYGADVTLLDSLVPQFGGSYFNISPIRDQVHVNISDMRDANSLDVLVQGQDYIFNLAGQVSHGDSMRDPQLDLAVQLRLDHEPGRGLPQAQPATCGWSTRSTRQVYGRPQQLPVKEDHPDRADRCQRHQQAGGRVLPPAVPLRLRHPLDRAAADEHLRPAATNPQQPAGLRRASSSGWRSAARRSVSTAAASRCGISITSTTW